MPKKSDLGLKPVFTDSGVLAKIVLHRGKFKDDDIIEELPLPDVSSFDQVIQARITGYGFAKVLMDRVSGVEMGPEKLAGMRALLERFAQGEWTAERTVGAPVVSVFVEALAALKGIGIAETQKALAGYSKEQKAAMAEKAEVKAKMAEITAARAKAEETSLDDLL